MFNPTPPAPMDFSSLPNDTSLPPTLPVNRFNHSMSTIGMECSKVLFIKPLPKNIIESALRDEFEEFGPVTTVIILRRPRTTQALIEMESMSDAQKVMAQYQNTPMLLEEESVDHTEITEVAATVQYSKSQELRAIPSPSANSGLPSRFNRSMSVGNELPHTGQKIIIMTFQGMPHYPVTTNMLYDIFSTYGTVQKIVVFLKSVGLQALLQYDAPDSARDAKEGMNGQNILPTDEGCQCWVSYSKLSELAVRENGLRTRDYTNPSLPAPAQDAPVDVYEDRNAALYGSPVNSPVNRDWSRSNSGTSLPHGSPVLLFTNLNEKFCTTDVLFNLTSSYGTVMKIRKMYTKPGHAFVQMENYPVALRVMGHLRGFTLFGQTLEIQESKHYYISYHRHHHSITTGGPEGEASVVMTPEALAAQESLLYQEYSRKDNRFTGKYLASSKYMTNPTLVLHVSNLAMNMTYETLKAHLATFEALLSFTVTEIKIFERNEHAQALLRFTSVDQATDMLALAHNSLLVEKHIKIAFSTHSMNTDLPPPAEVETSE